MHDVSIVYFRPGDEAIYMHATALCELNHRVMKLCDLQYTVCKIQCSKPIPSGG